MIAGDDSLDPMDPQVHVSNNNFEAVKQNYDFEESTVVGYSQRREHTRYACSNKAMITDIETKEVRSANLINLSTGGVALSIKAEDDLDLNNIQIEIFDGKTLKSFVAQGEVKYIRGVSPFLIIGVKFTKISRLSVRRIEDFSLTASEYM